MKFPYKSKLTKEDSVSEAFALEGCVSLVIAEGVGKVVLERSVENGPFYPLSTNLEGGVASFEVNGDCAYNGVLEEKSLGAKYRLVGYVEEGSISFTVSRKG